MILWAEPFQLYEDFHLVLIFLALPQGSQPFQQMTPGLKTFPNTKPTAWGAVWELQA